MSVLEVARKRRTIRKFSQKKIDTGLLIDFIDAARLSPSAANMQPIKYILVNNDEKVKEIFECVKWAAYIAPKGNPQKGEEPTAYIVILADTSIRNAGYELDIGAAAQTIMLSAAEEGIGTCWMGAIDRDKIRDILKIEDKYVINTVLAFGYSSEEPQVYTEDGTLRYHKDENGVLHVPKRKLEDILFKFV